MVMEKDKIIDNGVFGSAFIGATLLVIAIVVCLITLRYMESLHSSYLFMPIIPALLSVVLLYRANKKNKHRVTSPE